MSLIWQHALPTESWTSGPREVPIPRGFDFRCFRCNLPMRWADEPAEISGGYYCADCAMKRGFVKCAGNDCGSWEYPEDTREIGDKRYCQSCSHDYLCTDCDAPGKWPEYGRFKVPLCPKCQENEDKAEEAALRAQYSFNGDDNTGWG